MCLQKPVNYHLGIARVGSNPAVSVFFSFFPRVTCAQLVSTSVYQRMITQSTMRCGVSESNLYCCMPFASHPDDVFLHLGELPPGKQRFEVVFGVLVSTDAIVLVDNRCWKTMDIAFKSSTT
jgi:hypothetical protein